MAKDAYQIACERREVLRAELAELDQFLSMYQRLTGKVETSPEVEKPPENLKNPTHSATITHTRRAHKRLKPKDVARLAKDIILERGTPLTRGQLVEVIESMGYTIPSKDKGRYVGTVLWRADDVFHSEGGRGYWINGILAPGEARSDSNSVEETAA